MYIEVAPKQLVEDDQKEAEGQISAMYTIDDDEEEECEGKYVEAEVSFEVFI